MSSKCTLAPSTQWDQAPVLSGILGLHLLPLQLRSQQHLPPRKHTVKGFNDNSDVWGLWPNLMLLWPVKGKW